MPSFLKTGMLARSLPFIMLGISNVFMTYAWYGHLKDMRSKPILIAILLSWSVALFEYFFQVPANRIGSSMYTLPQLKIAQEIITMVIFALFCAFYMKQKLTLDFLWASLCLLGAAYFIFRNIPVK